MTREGSRTTEPPPLPTSVAAAGRQTLPGIAALPPSTAVGRKMRPAFAALPPSTAVVVVLGFYTLLGCLTSFLGWAVDVPVLSDWDLDGIAIQPNATVAAMAAGAALIALVLHRPRATAALGGVVLALCALTMLEYLTGTSFGIDTPLTF